MAVEREADGLGAISGRGIGRGYLGRMESRGSGRRVGWIWREACSWVASAYEKPMPGEDMGFEARFEWMSGPDLGHAALRTVPRAADQMKKRAPRVYLKSPKSAMTYFPSAVSSAAA